MQDLWTCAGCKRAPAICGEKDSARVYCSEACQVDYYTRLESVLTWIQRGGVSYNRDLFFLELSYLKLEDAARELEVLLKIDWKREDDIKRKEQALKWLLDPKSNLAITAPYRVKSVSAVFSVMYYYALKNKWFTLSKWLREHQLIDPFLSTQEVSREFFQDPLPWAVKHGYAEMITLLLQDARIDPAANRNWAIIEAAYEGRAEVVALLLQDVRVNPADQDNQAIIWAAEQGRTEVVALLLQDARVNPADQTNRAIDDAAGRGHTETVALLLQDARVNPAAWENSAIIQAARFGHAEVVALLSQDDRVNPADQDNSAIIDAAERGHVNVVALLLQDARVNPTAQNNAAIIEAAGKGYVEIVALLTSWYETHRVALPKSFKQLQIQI